jgi:hypothetical protein
MTEERAVEPSDDEPGLKGSNQRLAILLSMAMFVFVVDTSIMNVSISAGVLGLGNSFRMIRLPDPQSSGAGEGLVLG